MAGRKITFKRGLEVNLPQLDVAEFGFTIDSKRPFIGSDTGNIEIAKQSALTTEVEARLSDRAETTLNGKYFKFETISDMVDGAMVADIIG